VIGADIFDAHLGKKLGALVIAQEKGMEAVTVRADQSIAASPAKPYHRQQRYAPKILFGLIEATKIRFVFMSDTSVGGDNVVRLDNEEAGVNRIDCLPNPIFISIDIK
jgi:hypothetical protein